MFTIKNGFPYYVFDILLTTIYKYKSRENYLSLAKQKGLR